jgi:hypothetical protein
VFSLKERDDREQKGQQFLDQLRVNLIEFAMFDAIDEPLDLVRISGGAEHKCFLFLRGPTAGTQRTSIRTP